MIADAVDAAITLGWALAAWLLVLAALCTVALLGAVALTVWAWTAATRALDGPSWARGRVRARIHAARRLRAPHGRLQPRIGHHAPWRGRGAPQTAPRGSRAEQPTRPAHGRTGRHTPATAHTDHHTHQESA